MKTTECLVEALNDLRSDPRRVADERFWRIVERYRATLINQAFCILSSQEDAEDVAQETLCKAFTALHQLKDASKLGSWLRSINRRNALAVHRRQTQAREERLSTAQAGSMPSQKTGHVTAGVRQDMRDRVARAIEELPEPFREVLVLRYWEKLSNEQIAARLDIADGTVRSRLSRADHMVSDKLKSFLSQEQHKP